METPSESPERDALTKRLLVRHERIMKRAVPEGAVPAIFNADQSKAHGPGNPVFNARVTAWRNAGEAEIKRLENARK